MPPGRGCYTIPCFFTITISLLNFNLVFSCARLKVKISNEITGTYEFHHCRESGDPCLSLDGFPLSLDALVGVPVAGAGPAAPSAKHKVQLYQKPTNIEFG